MQTFKEYITEAKQVGIIYHFTTIYSLDQLLHTNPPFKLISKNKETISATRNKTLPITNINFSDCDVRLIIDGNKLSERYKVKPLLCLADDSKDVFNLNHKNRVKRSDGESEETILNHPLELLTYIKHIHIIRHNSSYEYIENNIIPLLHNLNIPVSHTKSFTVTTESSLKEDYSNLGLDLKEILTIN